MIVLNIHSLYYQFHHVDCSFTWWWNLRLRVQTMSSADKKNGTL